MNRHARRAASKLSPLASSLDNLSEAAEKLQPLLMQIEALKVQLAEAASLVKQMQTDNARLADALTHQRELYFRLFAQGMGVPLAQIVSMASEIETQLKGEDHGITDPRPSGSEGTESNDQSARAQD